MKIQFSRIITKYDQPCPIVKFEIHDLWIGVYWQYDSFYEFPDWHRLDFYICLLPTFLIQFRIDWWAERII